MERRPTFPLVCWAPTIPARSPLWTSGPVKRCALSRQNIFPWGQWPSCPTNRSCTWPLIGCDSGGCGLGYVEVFDPASGRELAVIDTFPNESYAIPAVALSVAPTGGPSICYSAMKVLLAQDGWRRLIRLL